MATDKQREYLKKWLFKAEQEKDVFDCFISGWIALTIAAQRHLTHSAGAVPCETDRERVISYFRDNEATIRTAVEKHRDQMKTLAERRGTRGGTVVDGMKIQGHCKIFKDAVLLTARSTDLAFAEAVAEILNKVRNKLFHGNKGYDDTEDRRVVSLVSPLLLSIVRGCERLTNG